MMQLENPSIIVDLRANNGFKGKKFDIFWDEMEAYFNEVDILIKMQIAISIRNLRKIIIHRLEAKYDLPLPCNINIPSIEWIRLQFWPTNPTSTRAMHYNGQFNIKYQIQARQLPDDMHKVPIREGVATSTGVRNKKSLVSTNTTLTASDYDFTKLSLTPSVIFFIDVPTTIEDSFYHGNVFVSYKDTVFQPSNAIRHATEFFNAINAIQTHYISTIPPSYLFISLW
ncbi:hypothetical protein RirG_140310 [Rhizophagus irregularis DAOM 197198w]|uniref:Uncharacterized protein n=1 Tax=Rhizophagus irregularis (strain DAOM 197198w) TaxID=1432141 RepID=A0A015KXH0_RHIIW|nr:hypothetical protein RirG_140310 [Rhizophagus irregularis DAOM 197198w]